MTGSSRNAIKNGTFGNICITAALKKQLSNNLAFQAVHVYTGWCLSEHMHGLLTVCVFVYKIANT